MRLNPGNLFYPPPVSSTEPTTDNATSDAPEGQPGSYDYGERPTEDLSAHALTPGEGRISGAISLFLGVGSFLGMLCFHFPEWLTTRELREVYEPGQIRVLLATAMYASLGFGVFSFLRTRGRLWLGGAGVALTVVTFLAGGYRIPVGAVEQHGPGFGVDWMLLDLLVSVLLFIFIEKRWPRHEQPILRPEWQLDLGYFALNHLLIGALLLWTNAFAPTAFGWAVNSHVQGFVSGLWLPLQVLLLMFCADFVQYWLHRAYHEVPALWGLHAVHHSAEYMDWVAGSRTHVVQTLLDRSLVFVPLYLLGPDQEALNIYVLIVTFQAVLIHANVSWKFGPLRHIFVTPQFHHWHHSKDKPAIDTNYAAHLSFLDRLFGTFHMPDDYWPKEYGTVTRLPRTFFAQFLYPFKKSTTKPEEERK